MTWVDGLLRRFLELSLLPGYVGVFVEHFHKRFLLVLS